MDEPTTIRARRALEPGRGPSWRDHAGRAAFDLAELEQLIEDCETQPEWRERAATCCAYYDGKQLDAEQLEKLRQEKIKPRVTNLIFGVVNGVLGEEVKSRADPRIEADDDESADVRDVLNMRLKEAQRETWADLAISTAYAGMVKAGIGWVDVDRNADPLDYPYRVEEVHRDEVWWDWRAKDILLRDARWIVRRRWQDLDELVAKIPEHRRVLMAMSNNYTDYLVPGMDDDVIDNAVLRERRLWNTVRRSEWFDSGRRRVKLYEIQYRVPADAIVLHLGPTRRVLYDERNPLHVQFVNAGVKVTRSVTTQVRRCLFAGPHRLWDIGTTRRNFSLIPFQAFRDDQDKVPYGLVHGMLDAQDEYNDRRLKIQWLLKARQILVDNDALDTTVNTLEDLSDEAGRPDMMLVLNAMRRNANAVRVEQNLSLQREQMEVMQDAKQLVQDVPRVYSSMLGSAPSGVTSGVANSLLIEQGQVALAEMNDNYRMARRAVYEALVDLLIEDHSQPDMQVVIGKAEARRVIVLNTFDEQGLPVNHVADAAVRVGMSDVPTSPAYRAQRQAQVANIIGALQGNPQAVAVLTPLFIEDSGLDNAKAVADDIRRLTGLPTAEDRQAMEQQRQAQQQQQAAAAEMQGRLANAEVASKEAEAAKKGAEAQLTAAKAAEAGVAAQRGAAELAGYQPPPGPVERAQQMREQAAADEDALIQQAIAEAMQA